MERLIALLLFSLGLLGQQTERFEIIDLTTRPLSSTRSYPALNAAAPRGTVPDTRWRNDAVGDTLTVAIVSYDQQRAVNVTVQLAAVDGLIYVWVEHETAHAEGDLSGFARRMAEEVVAPVDALWGADTEAFQIHLVLTERTGGLDAYYQYQPFDELAAPRMIINSARFPTLDDPLLWSRLAHEYQHLLRHVDTGGVPAWLDEGYSTFTEQALGLSDVDYLVNAYRAEPRTPLMSWNGTLADYGAALLFVDDFQRRFGGAVLRELARERGHGYQALNRTLSLRSEINVEALLADFVATQLAGRMTRATPIRQLPYSTRGTLPQTGTDLYRLPAPASGTLRLDFTQPTDAPLLADTPCGQRRFFYALPLDNSRALLETTLDLRSIDDPTLAFEFWYDLEQHWDYAYIAASADGQTWTYLTTSAMTSDNPWQRARAAGYTGSSGGWMLETLDLSAFAGQQVTLRLEVTHDESKTSWGVALDNVRLGRSGTVETFDTEPANWQAEGWAWVDGCLPQRTWVQIVQRVGGQAHVVRILTDRPFTQEVVLPAGAQGEVFIAITPVTPYTLYPLLYTLSISAP